MGRKFGRGLRQFFSERAGSPSNAKSPEAYVHAKCHLDLFSRLATINIGRKFGGSAPFWGGRAVSPSNTKSPGPRPTSVPSGILLHPAIWPQQIWAEN